MSLLRGALLLMCGEGLVILLGIARSMILSRSLGPVGIGQYSLYQQALLLTTQLVSLGLPMAAIHAMNSCRKDASVVTMTTGYASLFMGVFGAVLLLSAFVTFRGFFGMVPLWALVGAVAFIPFVLLRQTAYFLSTARLHARLMTLVRVAPDLLSFGVIVILWVWTDLVRLDVVMLLTFGAWSLIGFIMAWLGAGRHINLRATPDLAYLRSAIPIGLQFTLTDILYAGTAYIAFTSLRLFSPDFNALGYFSRALSISMLFMAAGRSVLSLLYSKWSLLSGVARYRHVAATVSLAFAGSLVVSAPMILFSDRIVLILYGREFLPAVPGAQVLMIGTVCLLFASMLQSLFAAEGKPHLSMVFLAVGALANIGACATLVPLYGHLGAAWGCSFAYVAMAVTAGAIVWRRYGLSPLVLLVPTRLSVSAIRQALGVTRNTPDTVGVESEHRD